MEKKEKNCSANLPQRDNNSNKLVLYSRYTHKSSFITHIWWFLVIALIFGTLSASAQNSYFFYSFYDSPYTFNRRDLDSENAKTLYTPPNEWVSSAAVDGSIGKVYFYDSDIGLGVKKIYKSNYDGSNIETMLTPIASVASLAAGNGYLFYAYDEDPWSLRRMNSDGTNDIQIYQNPDYGWPFEIAYDAINNKLYFFEYEYNADKDNRLVRTDADGSNLTVIYNNMPKITCLAAGNGKVFFSLQDSPFTFMRRDSDGSNPITVYEPATSYVFKCAFDQPTNKILFYHPDISGSKTIFKADIDGSNRITIYDGFSQTIKALSAPVGASTDPEIDIKGNSISINDGDTLPSTGDHTDFGSQLVSSGSLTRTFMIENTGGDTLFLTGTPLVAISGTHAAEFVVSSLPSDTILASASTTFKITFNPADTGLRVASLSIANNDDDENPYNFNIEGTGVAPEMQINGNSVEIADGDLVPSIADSTDFGSVNIPGGSLDRLFVIKNNGSSVLVLSGSSPYITIAGHTADFTLSTIPADSIAAGDSTIFQVNFTPSAVGLRSASISIANNDSNENPYNFSIQGTGVAVPDISVEGNHQEIPNGDVAPNLADSTKFGDVNVHGETVTHTFKIKNSGLATLNLSGTPLVAVTGHTSDFTISTLPTNSVPANNDSTSFQVTFNPTTGGTRSASLSIASNDPYENPYVFGVEGTGIYTTPTVQADSILFSEVGAAEINISWKKGNGTHRVVFVKQANSSLPTLDDDSTYTANTHLGKGDQLGTTGWYCVYNGSSDSAIVNGLMPGLTYRVMVCEYNGNAGYEKYLITEANVNATNQLTKNIIINEVDVDTESTDILEFIELYDGGTGNTSLDGLIMIHFNGSDDQSVDFGSSTYAIDLNGYKTDANGYFVVGNSGVTGAGISFTDNNLQNGPDAVALYADSASNFPNDTPITTSYLIDAIVYDTDDADDAGLLPLLNASQPQVNEAGGGDKDNQSNQRIPNGTGGLRNTDTYDQQPPTPGTRNNALPASADSSISVDEDVVTSIGIGYFTYSDADTDPLYQIQLITKPAKGSLFLDSNEDGLIDTGEDLTNNDTILRTQISDNKLKYLGALNEFGSSYTSFEFRVHDSLAYSESNYKKTINVAAVNDLPTAADDTVTTPEDIAKVFAASEFNYSDIEGSTMQQIRITLIPDDGTLFNDANTNGFVDSGEEIANNELVTKAHIDANQLKFKPTLNEFGSPYTYFNFKVHDGMAYSDSAFKMTVDVSAVNDLPTSADSSFACPISTDHVINATEFLFNDVDGDDLDSLLIFTVPVKGTIYYDTNNSGTIEGGESIGSGSFVTRAMLDSGKLKYKPIADENGQPYTTFSFKVNDGTGSSAATYTMTINVFPEFIVGGIAEDMIICHNSIPNPITGLAPTGGNTPYTYQWQSSMDGVNFDDIDGATNLDYQPGTLNDTTYFRQIQTSSSGCGTRITNTVTIYTLEEFIAGTLSANQTLCYNSKPVSLVGSAPTGGKPAYTYQWQQSVDGTNFSDISGETTLEYQPSALTQTTYFRILQTSSSGCGMVATNTVKIHIYAQFKAGSISETQVLYYRTLPEKFIGVAPTGGTGPYFYQWQQSLDGVNFTDIYGANEIDYQAGRLSKTTYFRLIQSSASGCGQDMTNRVMIIVFPEFKVGFIAENQHIVYNTTPEKLSATEPRGGRHPYTYQWQISVDGINFTDIAGATELDYQPGALTDTTYFRQIQSAALGYADKPTNVLTIFVYPEFTVGSIAESQLVCYDHQPELILGIPPTGGDLPYSYQWEGSVDGLNFSDIVDATELNYQPPALTQKMYYRQVQTSASNCGSFVTNAVVMTIQVQPVVDIALEEDIICSNTTYQLSATAQNHESVTWLSLGDGTFDDVNILNPIYTPGSGDIANGSVTLAINALALSPCEMMATDEMILSYYDAPEVNAGEDLTVYENSEVQLTASVVGSGNYTYQWSPASLVSDPSILNPVTLTLNQTTTFNLIVTDNTTGCVFEDQVTFTIEPGVTYQISGKVESIGLKNSLPQTQVYFTGINQSTFTDGQGEYSMQVPSGYSGWAIPSRAGYVFEPDSIAFNHVESDVLALSLEGTLYLRALASTDSIIAGQSVELWVEFINGSSAVTACSWQDETGEFCNTEIATVEPSQTTVYTVFVSDEYESTFDTVRVYVSTTTGINDLEVNEDQIELYPNPTKNLIKLEISGALDAQLISIVNPNGTLVRQIKLIQTANDHNIQINFEHLIDGTYYLVITNSKGVKICSKKVVKI